MARLAFAAGAVLLLLLSGCSADDATSPSTSRAASTSSTSASSPAHPTTNSPTVTSTAQPLAPIPWKPLSCDRSDVRLMPRNAPANAATNATSAQVVARMASALGTSVVASDPLSPSEAEYADAAWQLGKGRIVEHVEAETGEPSQWAYKVQDQAIGAAWLADPEGKAAAFLASFDPPPARSRATHTVANTTEVVLTFPLPLDLGELPMLQAFADVSANGTRGSLEVRLYPLSSVAKQGLVRDRPALQSAARDFLDCWVTERSNYRNEWSIQPAPSFPVVRGEGVRLRVPYRILTEKETCYVAVDADAETGAIWDVSPTLELGAALDC